MIIKVPFFGTARHFFVRFYWVLTLLLCFPTLTFAQGDSGFLRGEGHLDIALTLFSDRYDEFWFGSDKVEDPPFGRVDRNSLSIYAAYGWSDNIDLTVVASYVESGSEHLFEDDKDLQDMVGQVKWRISSWTKSWGSLNLILAPSFKLPLTTYENDAVTAIGDRQFDLRLRGILQAHFHNGAFVALDTGYDIRRGDPPDEIPFHLTGGFTLSSRLTLSAYYTRVDSLQG